MVNMFLAIFTFPGCTTSWKETGSYYRMTQTLAHVESEPRGEVKVQNRYVGDSPVEVPLQYEQKVVNKSRKVSYWISQPGWSLFVSIVSLGLYLPFSVLPVDEQSSLDAQNSFRGNEFNIQITAPEYLNWDDVIRPKGEQEMRMLAVLQKDGNAK